jgi:Zn-dependent protease with chaperone function
MNKEIVLNDYKKWLYYSFDNQTFENHYNLFKALQTGRDFEAVKILRSDNDGVHIYTVSVDSAAEELQLTDDERRMCIQYLVDNYFHTSDVEELMTERRQLSEMGKNHNFIGQNTTGSREETEYRVKPHPKESFYFNIKLVVSLIFYAVVAGIIVYGAISNIGFIFMLLFSLPVALFLYGMNKLLHGLFLGLVRGSSIQITKEQYPEVYDIIEGQARKLNIAVPEIYITSGHFNAFVTKVSRAHILMIYSEVIETALKGNYDVLKYVTAHELCHIKQKHLAKRKYLFPSAVIPFLNLAYSRGCEYTCDRTGYHFSPKGAVEGILIMTTGKEIHSKFSIELHIQNAIANEGFWTWFSEKFLTHPHLYKRLIQIKDFSRYN